MKIPLFITTCLFSARGLLAIDDKLFVHIIPHSHDDVGWLKTVDQYYYGTNLSISKNNVQHILNTVFDSLLKNINRKFIYSEMAFFTVCFIYI